MTNRIVYRKLQIDKSLQARIIRSFHTHLTHNAPVGHEKSEVVRETGRGI